MRHTALRGALGRRRPARLPRHVKTWFGRQVVYVVVGGMSAGEAGAEEPEGSYDLRLQLVGLGVVLAVSLAGVSSSFALAAWHRTGRGGEALLLGVLALKGTGCGVMISTALVHLVGEAYSYFEQAGWSETYEAWPMVFVMLAILFMAVSDFLSNRVEILHLASPGAGGAGGPASPEEGAALVAHGGVSGGASGELLRVPVESRLADAPVEEGVCRVTEHHAVVVLPAMSKLASVGHGHSHGYGRGHGAPAPAAEAVRAGQGAAAGDNSGAGAHDDSSRSDGSSRSCSGGGEGGGGCGSSRSSDSRPGPAETRALSNRRVLALELSVILHSLIIGFDLGLQDVEVWRIFIYAVCAHQFFEGLALGQVINANRSEHRRCAILVALAFALTTALGIGLGILVRKVLLTSGEEEPVSVLLLIGILNSFCGGLLLYLGVVSLLVPWFVANEALLAERRLYAIVSFTGVAAGMAVMAVIGIWA